MILIQTLSKPTRRPRIEWVRDREHRDLWYLDLCVWRFQICFYCRAMSEKLTAFVNGHGAKK